MKKTLAEIRETNGVTKGAVASLIGVSYPTYQRYEADPGRMRVSDFDKVCRFLHVRKDEIFLPRDLN